MRFRLLTSLPLLLLPSVPILASYVDYMGVTRQTDYEKALDANVRLASEHPSVSFGVSAATMKALDDASRSIWALPYDADYERQEKLAFEARQRERQRQWEKQQALEKEELKDREDRLATRASIDAFEAARTDLLRRTAEGESRAVETVFNEVYFNRLSTPAPKGKGSYSHLAEATFDSERAHLPHAGVNLARGGHADLAALLDLRRDPDEARLLFYGTGGHSPNSPEESFATSLRALLICAGRGSRQPALDALTHEALGALLQNVTTAPDEARDAPRYALSPADAALLLHQASNGNLMCSPEVEAYAKARVSAAPPGLREALADFSGTSRASRAWEGVRLHPEFVIDFAPLLRADAQSVLRLLHERDVVQAAWFRDPETRKFFFRTIETLLPLVADLNDRSTESLRYVSNFRIKSSRRLETLRRLGPGEVPPDVAASVRDFRSNPAKHTIPLLLALEQGAAVPEYLHDELVEALRHSGHVGGLEELQQLLSARPDCFQHPESAVHAAHRLYAEGPRPLPDSLRQQISELLATTEGKALAADRHLFATSEKIWVYEEKAALLWLVLDRPDAAAEIIETALLGEPRDISRALGLALEARLAAALKHPDQRRNHAEKALQALATALKNAERKDDIRYANQVVSKHHVFLELLRRADDTLYPRMFIPGEDPEVLRRRFDSLRRNLQSTKGLAQEEAANGLLGLGSALERDCGLFRADVDWVGRILMSGEGDPAHLVRALYGRTNYDPRLDANLYRRYRRLECRLRAEALAAAMMHARFASPEHLPDLRQRVRTLLFDRPSESEAAFADYLVGRDLAVGGLFTRTVIDHTSPLEDTDESIDGLLQAAAEKPLALDPGATLHRLFVTASGDGHTEGYLPRTACFGLGAAAEPAFHDEEDSARVGETRAMARQLLEQLARTAPRYLPYVDVPVRRENATAKLYLARTQWEIAKHKNPELTPEQRIRPIAAALGSSSAALAFLCERPAPVFEEAFPTRLAREFLCEPDPIFAYTLLQEAPDLDNRTELLQRFRNGNYPNGDHDLDQLFEGKVW